MRTPHSWPVGAATRGDKDERRVEPPPCTAAANLGVNKNDSKHYACTDPSALVFLRVLSNGRISSFLKGGAGVFFSGILRERHNTVEVFCRTRGWTPLRSQEQPSRHGAPDTSHRRAAVTLSVRLNESFPSCHNLFTATAALSQQRGTCQGAELPRFSQMRIFLSVKPRQLSSRIMK